MAEKIPEKFLPIGTVVTLKGADKRVMILSYLIFPTGEKEAKKMYDYGACSFPEGVVDSKVGIGFNHTDIEKIDHMGLKEDDEFKKLNDLLGKYGEDIKAEFKKKFDKK